MPGSGGTGGEGIPDATVCAVRPGYVGIAATIPHVSRSEACQRASPDQPS